jgi:hypothetical protein
MYMHTNRHFGYRQTGAQMSSVEAGFSQVLYPGVGFVISLSISQLAHKI